MKKIVRELEEAQLRKDLPEFRVGDTVRVQAKIKEGEKERIQAYEGVVIAYRRGGLQSSLVVRKISYGVGVERIFPIHSPAVENVELISRGNVRRAKLYYLRELMGKAARIKGTQEKASAAAQA
jgi:large subunit ribosomal protein L19